MNALIWGTGQGSKIAIEFAHQMQWNIIAFIDNDVSKQGKIYEGKKVKLPADISSIR